MIREEGLLCPWISMIPLEVMEKTQNENEVLSIFRMYVKLTEEAIQIYQEGQFSELDALVGNYGCEVHAFNILALAHSEKLQAECNEMIATCKKITVWIDERHTIFNRKKWREHIPLEQFYRTLEERVQISTKMKFLVLSRLLTVTRKVQFDEAKFDEREYENFVTQSKNLRRLGKLKVQCKNDCIFNEIVSITQTFMSENSIFFMKVKLNNLILAQGTEGKLVQKMMNEENLCIFAQGKYRPKTYSCAYYNAKALLLLIAELKTPLIIKKMTIDGEPTELFYFKSLGVLGEFEVMTQEEVALCDPKTPAIMCKAYLPKEMTREEWLNRVKMLGLGKLILASASQESQYVPNKPEVFPIRDLEACLEIQWQSKVKANELGCIRGISSNFDLDHFYCTTWGKRFDENKQGEKK
jgi:hypothetical protein